MSRRPMRPRRNGPLFLEVKVNELMAAVRAESQQRQYQDDAYRVAHEEGPGGEEFKPARAALIDFNHGERRGVAEQSGKLRVRVAGRRKQIGEHRHGILEGTRAK